jgi:hypothetical protein
MQFMPPRKRPRMDKDEKINELETSIDVARSRVARGPANAELQAVVNGAAAIRPMIDIIGGLPNDKLREIAGIIHKTGNVDHRINTLAKLLVPEHFATIAALDARLRAGTELLQVGCELSIAKSYCTSAGQLDWSNLHDAIVKKLAGGDADM